MSTLLLKKREKGFSLIELMIALVLGLFIIGGVLAVFIGSSASFNSNESLSRVQEDGRFALEILTEDLRNVGYKGNCFVKVQNLIDTADADYEADVFDLNAPIKGWTDATGKFFENDLIGYTAGTDIVVIKHAVREASAELNMDLEVDDETFPTVGGEEPGAILIISNGETCDLFQNTAANNTADLKRGSETAAAKIGNVSVAAQGLGRPYKADDYTDISLLSSTLYYVGQGQSTPTALRFISYDNGVSDNGTAGGGDDNVLVEGVTGLTINYAVVSGAGPALDYSADADGIGDWGDVVAVRVTVSVTEDNISQDFSATVALRNRLE
ncbi:type IV pilus assembly protein PilW [Amphritea atlantica]|uniref:Type IV pilus assembly protein PilW n=1 Tax=Amphritea atlantica TaxID=355243 RepID=A0A1H9LMW7_9GAMM|nr:prepilin-type N-terminal cleavage/methylation domain-containing protein [Amphritea atlantica]SER12557.1 type IV pilus assembly protein PilW [Amphritea atlantica]